MDQQKTKDYLSSIGSCERCLLRFSTNSHQHHLYKFEVKNVKEVDWYCGSCLGILEERHIHDCIAKLAVKINDENYESSTFCLAISLPQCLLLREKSMILAMKQNKIPTSHMQTSDPLNVKDVLKICILPILEEMVDKKHDSKSELLVDLVYNYANDREEISKLSRLLPAQNSRKRKFYNKDKHEDGRNHPETNIKTIIEAVSKLNDFQLPQYTPCPPQCLTTSCSVTLKTLQGSIFIAGRYNKYSRNLSQTPWLIDGVRKTDLSVQELICDRIKSVYKAKETKFLSSGREDVDVQMLGSGRPFATELVDPKRISITQEEVSQLQIDINNATELIAVRDLQIIRREDLIRLKQGEEEKKKVYRAKVWCEVTIPDDRIEALNSMKDLLVDQKTPLRVLHRRPICVRQRMVHEISMQRIDDILYEISLKTQAGTYIKEFVHGDFGRTTPSLRSILGVPIDIIELDVDVVDLDWPPTLEVPNTK